MSSPSFGDGLCDAVKFYLVSNKLTSLGQINRAVLCDIAERYHSHHHEQLRLKKKRFTDDEWLADLQADPVNRGTDVRRQFDLAKLWCKQKQRNCTRAFFLNWLVKSLNEQPIIHEAPRTKEYRRATAYEPGDFDWVQWVAKKYPREQYPDRAPWEEMAYKEVPFSIRSEIANAQ